MVRQAVHKAEAREVAQLPKNPRGRVDLQRTLDSLHTGERHVGQLVQEGGFRHSDALSKTGGDLLPRFSPPGFGEDLRGHFGHFLHLGLSVLLDQAHIFRKLLTE